MMKESDDLDILGVTFDSKMTFEKHLRSVSRAASQRLGILRKSSRVFHDKLLIGRWFCGSAVWCSAAETHLKLLDRESVVPAFQLVACLTVVFNIVDLWQYCVCCTRSGVTRSTHFVAFYLCLMCQSGLHAVLWSHIEILLRLPAAEPHSTAGLLLPSQYLSGMIWLTPYLMVWDWRVSRTGPKPFCWPSCFLLFCLQLFSLSLLFLYRLEVWGWGLLTDRVSTSLSQPCIANLF